MAHIEIKDEGSKGKERYKVIYEVQSLNGKRMRKSKTFPVGTPYRTVEKFKKQVEYEYENGTAVYAENNITLGGYIAEYFEIWTAHLSPMTVKGYYSVCYKEKGILDYFSPDMKLSKVTVIHLQNFLNNMAKEGKSTKTIKNVKGVLGSLFSKACALSYITENPAKELVIPFNCRQKEEMKFMDIDNAKLALEFSASLGGNYETVEWIGILGGLRKGEMAALKFSNIFIDDGRSEIHVVEARLATNTEVITKAPKTQSGKRIVQIPEILADLLRRKRREYKEKKLKGGKDFHDDGYVFCNEIGVPLHPDTLYKHHLRCMKKLQAKYPDFEYVKLHGLRHSYATIAVETGMNVKSLSSQLGHSTTAMTMNLYAHSVESAKKEGASKINEIFKKMA